MNKSLFLLALAFLLAACTPVAASVENLTPLPTQAPTRPSGLLPGTLPFGTRLIIRSSSMTMVVDDPAKALSALEQAVEDAGGFVVSASYYSSPDYPGYSSLSARVSPEALTDLRRAALRIASSVQSDSVYSQDVTGEYRLLYAQLTELQQTEEHLWQLVTETKDRELAASFALLRDLIQQEATSVESQLLSYEDRSAFATFDVTLNQTVEIQIIIE
jgi:hypothetical protein